MKSKTEPMKLFIGKKLRPKEHIRDWDDEIAVIHSYSEKNKTWRVILDDNFSANLTHEEVERDFEELSKNTYADGD